MSANYFPTDFLDAMTEKRRKGRIFRAALLVREQQTRFLNSSSGNQQASELEVLIQDDDVFLKARQEQIDEQEARRQARQQWIQGE